jgi:hypothetical protein
MRNTIIVIKGYTDAAALEVELDEFATPTDVVRALGGILLSVGYARESVAKSLEEVAREHAV